MSLTVTDQPLPLAVARDGTVTVGTTRVTLDTVIAAFNDGATAEEIGHQYPTLDLADIYAVVAYYLRQREVVDQYLAARAGHREQVRAENQRRFDPVGVRDRLLARTRTTQ